MDGITVASTTDTMEDVNQAAGVEEPEQLEAPAAEKPQEKPESKPESAPKPSKSSAQKRFDAMTRKIHELEAKLEQREAPKAEPAPEPVQVQEPPNKPTWADFQTKGKTYEDFIDALTDWKAEQREALKAAAEAERVENERIRANVTAFNERLNAAREKYPDFDEVIGTDAVPLYFGVRDAIVELENGAEVAYWLGQNRDKAMELMKMSEARAIARIGQISAELGDGQVESEKPDSEIAEEEAEAVPIAKPKAKSAAPAPIRPVGGSATKSSVPMDELNYAEYRKIRDQQIKARYRR